MIKDYLLPSFVLTAVCTVTAALLVLANAVTEKPIARMRQKNTIDALSSTFGDGEYTEIDINNENIAQTFQKGDGTLIFRIVSSGYNKDGIELLIGVDSNGVTGIAALEISETKGVGTKVGEDEFLSQFCNADSYDDISRIDSVSGATYSSNGVKSAVACALKAFDEYSQGDL